MDEIFAKVKRLSLNLLNLCQYEVNNWHVFLCLLLVNLFRLIKQTGLHNSTRKTTDIGHRDAFDEFDDDKKELKTMMEDS